MKELEARILTDGRVLPGGILKVDSFLNHQLDPQLYYDMACEIKRLFEGEQVDKVLTVEASGIAFAIFVGYVMHCPVVFAKKSKTSNISDQLYSSQVHSFTHGNTNTVVVSREYLHEGERVLLIDDFLATGAALIGLCDLVHQAGGTVVGAGIAVEKAFQGGSDEMKKLGVRVESLAKIASMDDDGLTFC